MGLLDHIPDDTSPLLSRALRLRGEQSATEAPRPPASPAPSQRFEAIDGEIPVDPGAAARALLRELGGGRHSGIATPSHLFSVLHRHLQVVRGALMVPVEEDAMFVPAAIAGLDRTSAVRLRLDIGEVQSLVTPDSVRVLAGDEREIFAPYLSSGDFGTARRIALFPFFHLKRLLAVLAVFDSPALDLDGATLDTLLGALTDAAGQMLFNGRARLLGASTSRVVFGREHLATAIERVGRAGGSEGVRAITVDLQPIVDRILTEHRHLDRGRLTRDVIESCALLTAREFDVIRLGGMRLAFVGPNSDLLDPELMVHLLSHTIGELFCIPIHQSLEYDTPDLDQLTSDD